MAKDITIWTINQIKKCTLRIFEAKDDDIPNKRIISANEIAIDHYLKYKIEEEKRELLSAINWTNDNCIAKLKALGWKVLALDNKKQ